MNVSMFLMLVVLAVNFFKTLSYSSFLNKEKNTAGAVLMVIIGILQVSVPIIMIFSAI